MTTIMRNHRQDCRAGNSGPFDHGLLRRIFLPIQWFGPASGPVMYQQYWGLRESPFRGSLDVAQFFATPNHDEALARLHFLVDGRRRLGLVAGKFGIGKSLLLEVFSQRIYHDQGEVARVSLLGIDSSRDALVAGGSVWARPGDRRHAFCAMAKPGRFPGPQPLRKSAGTDCLRRCRRGPPRDFGSGPTTRSVRCSPACPPNSCPGDDRHRGSRDFRWACWNWPNWQSRSILGTLRKRPNSSISLSARQVASGPCSRRPRPSDCTTLAGGIPLRIKQLADLALLAGAGLDLRHIDADTVTEACHELGVIVPTN